MNKIPTAEEFLLSKEIASGNEEDRDIAFFELAFNRQEILNKMVAFTKLHVTAALEAAAENAKMELVCDTPETEYIDRDSILNAYPLNNIK